MRCRGCTWDPSSGATTRCRMPRGRGGTPWRWPGASALRVAEGLEWAERSGLRGRGGAGFPTGTKLRLATEAAGKQKYVVVNGAEDEPGSGKDHALLDRCPGLVVEGALIAARLVGAGEAVFYLSELYPSSAAGIAAAAAAGGIRTAAWGVEEDGDHAHGEVVVRLAVAPAAYISGEDT